VLPWLPMHVPELVMMPEHQSACAGDDSNEMTSSSVVMVASLRTRAGRYRGAWLIYELSGNDFGTNFGTLCADFGTFRPLFSTIAIPTRTRYMHQKPIFQRLFWYRSVAQPG
jgi:hypothetical protein